MAGPFNGMAEEARGIGLGLLDRLEQVVDQLREQNIEENFLYVRRVLNTAADDAVEDDIQLPPGVHWTIKRWAVTGGANGGFALYLDESQPQNLLDGEFDNAVIAADATDLWVPAGSKLVVRFYSQPVGQPCTVNLRIVETKQ